MAMHDGSDPERTTTWLVAGPLRLALPSGTTTVRGRAVALTEMEVGVLRLLLEGQGRPLGRTEILTRLHPGPVPEERVVDVFVCRLRAKLAQAGLPGIIGTVWRQGYLLRVAPSPGRCGPATPVPGFVPAPRAEVMGLVMRAG